MHEPWKHYKKSEFLFRPGLALNLAGIAIPLQWIEYQGGN
jgi:hypothetical protein